MSADRSGDRGHLLVTSLFAALSAFHNYIARYTYVAGREGLLPAVFGRTHDRHQSPHIGSVSPDRRCGRDRGDLRRPRLDPVLNLFTWVSQIGTLGILGMMTVTSIAVIAYFSRRQSADSVVATKVLPRSRP